MPYAVRTRVNTRVCRRLYPSYLSSIWSLVSDSRLFKNWALRSAEVSREVWVCIIGRRNGSGKGFPLPLRFTNSQTIQSLTCMREINVKVQEQSRNLPSSTPAPTIKRKSFHVIFSYYPYSLSLWRLFETFGASSHLFPFTSLLPWQIFYHLPPPFLWASPRCLWYFSCSFSNPLSQKMLIV